VESSSAWRSSIERHAYSFVLAPYDMAAPMRPIGRQSQRELVGDGGLADYFEHGSGVRQIADCAIDRGAAELNASSFENAMALGRAMFVHWLLLPPEGTLRLSRYAFLNRNRSRFAVTFFPEVTLCARKVERSSLISTQRRLFA
jgi:hypothetical protein